MNITIPKIIRNYSESYQDIMANFGNKEINFKKNKRRKYLKKIGLAWPMLRD